MREFEKFCEKNNIDDTYTVIDIREGKELSLEDLKLYIEKETKYEGPVSDIDFLLTKINQHIKEIKSILKELQ